MASTVRMARGQASRIRSWSDSSMPSRPLSYGFGGLSLDFNMSTLRAMGVRSRFQMGHPPWLASTVTSRCKSDPMGSRPGRGPLRRTPRTGMDGLAEVQARDSRQVGTSRAAISWLGHVYLPRPETGAGALILAFLCICMHARSCCWSPRAAQIALSFPLAYYVYKALLGIPLFRPLRHWDLLRARHRLR